MDSGARRHFFPKSGRPAGWAITYLGSHLIGGYLFGIPGMILAVPVYTSIKVIAQEFLSEYKIVKRLTKNL